MGVIIETRHIFSALALVALLGGFIVVPVEAHQGPHNAIAASPSQDEVAVGTVEDLTVDNRVKGTTRKYHLLRRQDGTTVPMTGPDADSLQDGASVAVEGSQEGSHFQVRHATELAPPAAGRRSTLPAVEVEGTLGIAHADDFESGRSQYHYHVQDDTGVVTRLNVSNLPAEVRGGSRVRVSGKRSADGVSLDPETVTVEAEPAGSSTVSSGLVAKAGTTNSVLVIMANFSNTAAPSFTASQAQQVMSSNSNSVANFFSEVSYGGQLLNVTVTSAWVTMNLAATCSYTNIASAANTAAKNLSAVYTASNYSFVVYVFPQQACGWLGLAYVGSPHQSFINGTGAFTTQVITHEMGHNFGLFHAGSLNCGSATIGGSCSAAEYGDPWDTMGNARAMHYNAAQKLSLGWIGSGTVKTHSSGSASYTLTPLESGGAATYAVKIPTSNASRTYWLEYRQPLGFDAPLSAYPNNGVQVRVTDPFEWAAGADDTEILDMTPGSSGGMGDSALVVGKSFLDSTYGVNIIVTGATANAVTVSVSKGGTITATATTLASSANPSIAATSVTFTATVTGASPTGTVNFKDGSSSISGCSAIALSGSGNSRTAQCATSTLTTGTHSITASYSGDANNAASSSAPLSQTVNGTTSTTGVATSLTPSTLGTSVTFTATVSGSSPTGTVNFKDGSSSISGCSAMSLSGSGNIRTAKCATTALTAGNHSITAAYGGDVSNGASTSAVLSQVVNGTASTASVAWVDDAVPTGAVIGASGGDTWRWVSSSPTPFSGNLANQSAVAAGVHQHYFTNATATLPVVVGDTLFAYVYLDPANPPSEVMLQWYDGSWEHRAYWGANLIAWGSNGTNSRRYMGALPAAGQWVQLAVPAAQVGLEGHTLNGMAFTLYNGRATWDKAGKTTAGSTWVEDAVPAGALLGSSGGDAWSWAGSNPTPFSGSLANQSARASGIHQHYFTGATATLSVAVGDTLSVYVYLDPANPPSEVMLQWYDGSWEHRAYWGANLIGWGSDGTNSRRYMGALPAAGQWVKLSVPAAQVGLESHTLSGMAFTLYNGRATWDHAGK